MQVYKDLLTGEEFFSDAKTIEPVSCASRAVLCTACPSCASNARCSAILMVQVKWVDPDTKEEVDTGLVRVAAKNQTAGGGAIDIGGGNEVL